MMKNVLCFIFYNYHILFAANSGIGFLLLVLLFIFCFAMVHIARLAKFGWQQKKKPNPPKKSPQTPTKQKEKAPAPPQEPIYYIVERKQRRAKPRYGEPKEIRFKD